MQKLSTFALVSVLLLAHLNLCGVSHDRPLFKRYPKLKAVPHKSLGNFPTPIKRCKTLGPQLGIKLYIKQDDLTGKPFGGNKRRKL